MAVAEEEPNVRKNLKIEKIITRTNGLWLANNG